MGAKDVWLPSFFKTSFVFYRFTHSSRLTIKQVITALLQQALNVEGDKQLGTERVTIQVRRQSKGHLQHGYEQEATRRCLPVPALHLKEISALGPTLTVDDTLTGFFAHHFKEHGCGDSHPVQLDLKGSIEREVAMVIATAPFRPIAAIVHVDVQGDCFLLRNCGSCEGRGKERETERGRAEMAERMK